MEIQISNVIIDTGKMENDMQQGMEKTIHVIAHQIRRKSMYITERSNQEKIYRPQQDPEKGKAHQSKHPGGGETGVKTR